LRFFARFFASFAVRQTPEPQSAQSRRKEPQRQTHQSLKLCFFSLL
jgi:hypothetical protein